MVDRIPAAIERTSSRRRFIQHSTLSTAAIMALHGRVYAAPKRGWIELFNGKDLSGWHLNPEKIGHGTGGNWRKRRHQSRNAVPCHRIGRPEFVERHAGTKVYCGIAYAAGLARDRD